MRRVSIFNRCGFVLCAVAPMLASCGGGSTPLNPALSEVTTESVRAPAAFAVLYSFQGPPKDGESPSEALLNVNGTLYGTSGGGKHGAGTVFATTTSGKETVFYDFKGGSTDGANPSGALLNLNGTLYGATSYGGANDKGVIFAITTTRHETVLYSFKGGSSDGAQPSGALLNVNGILYGTTTSGGSSSCGGGGCGTAFSITTSGKETVLHHFRGGKTDGQSPNGSLVNVSGKLYGTTNAGGANCTRGVACGTVFSITTSGKETVLHSFKGADTDGQSPDAGVIYVKGKLYGTTLAGGAYGAGTVFSITTGGIEKVLHSFGRKAGDGEGPQAPLFDMQSTLYGTTVYGGSSGWGTVFEISTTGKEYVLHRFNPLGGGGYYPAAGLLNVNNTLYGTATAGGWGYCGGSGYDPGCGIVFALTP